MLLTVAVERFAKRVNLFANRAVSGQLSAVSFLLFLLKAESCPLRACKEAQPLCKLL
jgi:hypothetical protein